MQPRTSCEASCGRIPPNNSSAKNTLYGKDGRKKKIEQDLSLRAPFVRKIPFGRIHRDGQPDGLVPGMVQPGRCQRPDRRSERHDRVHHPPRRDSESPRGAAQTFHVGRFLLLHQLPERKRPRHCRLPLGMPVVLLGRFRAGDHHRRRGGKSPDRRFGRILRYPSPRLSLGSLGFGAEPR